MKFGEKVMVVGEKEGIEGVGGLLGNDVKGLWDRELLGIGMGMVLGVLLGKVEICLGGGMSLCGGVRGGVVMMGLLVSGIGKSGGIMWWM